MAKVYRLNIWVGLAIWIFILMCFVVAFSLNWKAATITYLAILLDNILKRRTQ